MSLREDEDRQKNCPSRGVGLGVAVAAIGVGVGAALYYFMNRRPENPNTAGSTTQDWTTEPEHTLHEMEDSDDSYTTISEHSTTDTSMNSTTNRCQCTYDNSLSDSDSDASDSSDSDPRVRNPNFSDSSDMDTDTDDNEAISVSSDSELTDWDVTNTLNIPSYLPTTKLRVLTVYRPGSARGLVSLIPFRSRKRTWSLEECSICFEVILRDQEVMSLPCTHHFHTKCILPWLQEQQTCPNCRKTVD